MHRPPTASPEREYARIAVRTGVRLRTVDPEEAERLRQARLETPSIWAPAGERALADLAGRPGVGAEALLADALLDVIRQVRRLAPVGSSEGGPMQVGHLVQLSGGGAQLVTDLELGRGDRIEMILIDDGSDVPQVRVVAEVIHAARGPDNPCGVRYVAIHPTDRERLIRFIYRMQRRDLRREAEPEPSEA